MLVFFIFINKRLYSAFANEIRKEIVDQLSLQFNINPFTWIYY
jgi:hypothetical protein